MPVLSCSTKARYAIKENISEVEAVSVRLCLCSLLCMSTLQKMPLSGKRGPWGDTATAIAQSIQKCQCVHLTLHHPSSDPNPNTPTPLQNLPQWVGGISLADLSSIIIMCAVKPRQSSDHRGHHLRLTENHMKYLSFCGLPDKYDQSETVKTYWPQLQSMAKF